MSTTCRLGAVFRDAKVTREPPRDQYVQRVDFFPEVAAGVAGLTGRGANGGPGTFLICGGPGTFLICERGTGDIPHLRGERGHSSLRGRPGTFLICGANGDIPHYGGDRGHSSFAGRTGTLLITGRAGTLLISSRCLPPSQRRCRLPTDPRVCVNPSSRALSSTHPGDPKGRCRFTQVRIASVSAED
jgi:hypothetical protein